MSEPVQLAKLARQHLAAALGALQESGIPSELMSIADPIAATMGIMHRVERSSGSDLSGRDEALGNVRGALQALQTLTVQHAAIDVVMDAVAQSLSHVHALSKYAPPQPAPQAYAPQPQPQAQAPQAQAYAPGPQAYAPPQPPPQPQPQAYAQPQPQPQAYAPPQPQPQAYAPPPPQAYAPPQPQPQPQAYAPPQPQPQPQAYAPPQAVAAQPAPQAVAAFAPAAQARPGHVAQAPAPQVATPFRAAADRARIDVELGTHSGSNFYKGLGGNDVIEAGGIFVATYKPQTLGASVDLRVLMPGNYEFFATALVQWIREGDGSTEPGFGARFTQISPEGRQLVYRYTRNREPIFYDDL